MQGVRRLLTFHREETVRMATDLRSEIRSRLAELRDEAFRLERALAALEGQGPGRPRKRGPGRPRGSGAGPVRRRRRKGGTRAEQALKAVSANPGMTVPEIAKQLGIQPNYVYRVMHELQRDKRVKKQGRGYAAA
jgi:hypothetical protein